MAREDVLADVPTATTKLGMCQTTLQASGFDTRAESHAQISYLGQTASSSRDSGYPKTMCTWIWWKASRQRGTLRATGVWSRTPRRSGRKCSMSTIGVMLSMSRDKELLPRMSYWCCRDEMEEDASGQSLSVLLSSITLDHPMQSNQPVRVFLGQGLALT